MYRYRYRYGKCYMQVGDCNLIGRRVNFFFFSPNIERSEKIIVQYGTVPYRSGTIPFNNAFGTVAYGRKPLTRC